MGGRNLEPFESRMRQGVLGVYADKEDSDQTVHLGSLIRVFTVLLQIM